jgi:hypothetical protein
VSNGMNDDATAEQAVRAGREHRAEMVRWLALEVLMTDEVAGRDAVLVERLSVLQELVEEDLRAKTRVAREDE